MERHFHHDLDHLRTDIIHMGDRTLDMVRLATRALVDHDPALAHQVRGMDDIVDDLETRVDAEVMRYLTLFAPLGRDVRMLIAARDIAHELERIADEASSIARRVIVISERDPVNNLLGVPAMAEIAETQVRLALESFVNLSGETARRVRPGDAEIDRLNAANYECVFGRPGDRNAAPAGVVELIFISKGYERIGDHAKNIAEQVIFLLSGENLRHSEQSMS